VLFRETKRAISCAVAQYKTSQPQTGGGNQLRDSPPPQRGNPQPPRGPLRARRPISSATVTSCRVFWGVPLLDAKQGRKGFGAAFSAVQGTLGWIGSSRNLKSHSR